jgi:tetratricopeptide (TPR) repeat protein
MSRMPDRSPSRRPVLVIAVVVAMSAGVVVGPAHAQATSDRSAEAAALALNHRGNELYQQGRYAEAVALLREAYRQKPEPVLQYNLARACEKMADYACAIAAYESYLASARAPADRAAVEAQLTSCRDRLAAATAIRALPPSTEPPLLPSAAQRPRLPEPVPRASSRSLIPPIVGAIGVVGIGVGLGLVSAARTKQDDAVQDPTQQGAAQKQERADSLMRAGNLALLGGAAVAASGILWWILDARSGRSAASSVAGTRAIHITARSVALTLTF